MVPRLLRGRVLVQVQVQVLARTKVKFVQQSKWATDPLRSTAGNYMSRSAPQVGKVVDQVSGNATERIYAVLRYLIHTGSLEWPNPRASRACLERISSSKPTKPDPMSIGTDRPMALVQTIRQGLHQIRLTGIVGTRDGSSTWLPVVLTEQPGSNGASQSGRPEIFK